MKAILYVGALLMVGASVYGFVDYRKSSTQNLYKTERETERERVKAEVVNPAATIVAPVAAVKKEAPKKATVAKKAVAKKKKRLSTKMYSRGRIVEDLPKPISTSTN